MTGFMSLHLAKLEICFSCEEKGNSVQGFGSGNRETKVGGKKNMDMLIANR